MQIFIIRFDDCSRDVCSNTICSSIKDLPKNTLPDDSGQIYPAPTPASQPELLPSQKIISGLDGVTGTVFSLAMQSGSFMIGSVYSLIVVIGILKANRHLF